jgi:hypothetical protein
MTRLPAWTGSGQPSSRLQCFSSRRKACSSLSPLSFSGRAEKDTINLVRFMFVRAAAYLGWAIVFVAMLFGKTVGLQVLVALFVGSVVLMEWFARRFRLENATTGDASQGSIGT